MAGGRLAATIAAAPVLVLVKGKDIVSEKGMEATSYRNGGAPLDEAQLRRNIAPTPPATQALPPDARHGRRSRRRSGRRQDQIRHGEFRTAAQDLINLKAGVSDAVIGVILQTTKRP